MKSFKSLTDQHDSLEHHKTSEYVKDTHNKLSAHYDLSKYTPKEKAAVYSYTEQSSNVNKSLRKHAGTDLYKTLPKKHYDIQAGVHSAIAKSAPLSHPLDVYHGTSSTFHTKGDVVTTHGITSTATTPNTAEYFAGWKKGTNQHLLRFKLPAGYKGGMYVNHFKRVNDMFVGDEHEFVLGHGQKWRRGAQYTAESGHTVTEMHPHD